MKTNIIYYLVKRFLRFDKEQPFIFLSALLAFLGITLGVMVLIIAMALMNGFDKEFQTKLTVMNYPITILPKFYGSTNEQLLTTLINDFPQLDFSPYVVSSVITRSGSKLEGGYIFGVDFKAEAKVNSVVKKAIKDGNYPSFSVLIGKSLKEEFQVQKDDKLMYIFTQVEPGGIAVTPKIKRFTVKNYFDSGLSAYDKAYSYTDIDSLQRVLNMPENQYDGIHVFSKDPQKDIIALKK